MRDQDDVDVVCVLKSNSRKRIKARLGDVKGPSGEAPLDVQVTPQFWCHMNMKKALIKMMSTLCVY